MKTLVLVAHPDDEVLAMGGTIKKLSKVNNDIKILFLSTGIFARRSSNYTNSTNYSVNETASELMNKQVKKLRINAKKAVKILGVKNVEFADFPDNEMDTVSNLEITKRIERVLQEYKPDTVFTHSQYDINVDHRAIYFATITATRPTKNPNVQTVISFEVPSSTEWYFPSKFSPNIFVDISKELSFKLKAIRMYKHELRKYPHPRSIKAIDIIAKRWGTVSGYSAAEAFCLIRQLKI